KVDNNVLAPGESRTVYIELIGSWMKTAGIFLPGLHGERTLRCWFQSNDVTVLSGTAPTVTNFELIIDTGHMTDNEFNNQLDKYRNGPPLDFRYPFFI